MSEAFSSAKYLWSRYKIVPQLPIKLSFWLLKKRLAPPFQQSFHQRKFIFIHIPKTGGSSVGKSLCGTDTIGHYPYYIHQSIDPISFSDYYKFCFVREPVARFISGYYYLKIGGKGPLDFKLRKYLCGNINEFVQSGYLEKYLMDIVHFVPQNHFVSNNGSLVIDEFFKLEDISSATPIIKDKCGIQLRDIRENQAQDEIEQREQLESKSLEMIKAIYSKDYSIFNY